jgi:NCS2 family nucleobase:cation symporter-2
METGFAVTAFVNLLLNLILPEEIEDEETPELTADAADEAKDEEEWARIRAKEGRASSEIGPAEAKV